MFQYYYNYYKQFARTVKWKMTAAQEAGLRAKYLQVGIIDPSIASANLGDYIIYDAVHGHLRLLFKDALLSSYPSQLHYSYDAKFKMSQEDFLFVAGTNLLSSYMNKRFQWRLDPLDKFFLKGKVVLVGAGWWQYQEKPNRYTQKLLHTVLSKDYTHSVRDSYTADMLRSIGIENVVNTSCPTMWNITPAFCSGIKRGKAPKVITTLTFYKKDVVRDKAMLDYLIGHYETVYLWVQGMGDIAYLEEIGTDASKITLVPPTVEAFNNILENEDVDYLGTRLHAGIRALQKGRRTLIVAVDNRAYEISKDTNLNVIKRENVRDCLRFIQEDYATALLIPVTEIHLWKQQFSSI